MEAPTSTWLSPGPRAYLPLGHLRSPPGSSPTTLNQDPHPHPHPRSTCPASSGLPPQAIWSASVSFWLQVEDSRVRAGDPPTGAALCSFWGCPWSPCSSLPHLLPTSWADLAAPLSVADAVDAAEPAASLRCLGRTSWLPGLQWDELMRPRRGRSPLAKAHVHWLSLPDTQPCAGVPLASGRAL